MKMKCHKLLPAPTVGSEDKLISETQCSGYFHHCVHFGYYLRYDLAQCEQLPGKSFFFDINLLVYHNVMFKFSSIKCNSLHLKLF